MGYEIQHELKLASETTSADMADYHIARAQVQALDYLAESFAKTAARLDDIVDLIHEAVVHWKETQFSE
jgi:hypothetical protein